MKSREQFIRYDCGMAQRVKDEVNMAEQHQTNKENTTTVGVPISLECNLLDI